MPSYSFLDVSAAINGPGGVFSIREGAASEGITITPTGDQSTMTTGADGSVMHSLSAGSSCTVTIRLLKTSPCNAKLMTMFNFQTGSSSRHGRNTIAVRDSARGDIVVVSEAAFKKVPDLTYATEGGTVEWVFDGGTTSYVLGVGTAEL